MTGDVTGAAPTPAPATPTARPTLPADGRRARVTRLVLAALLIGGWLAWAGVAYATQARMVSGQQFITDLEAGDITAFRAVSGVTDGDRLWHASPYEYGVPAADPSGMPLREGAAVGVVTVMYWTDNAIGRVRIVDANEGAFVTADERIIQLQRAGVPLNTRFDGPSDLSQAFAIGAGLLAFLVVVGGPTPTRGTRWFWFWMLGLTWGQGVVAYAVFELLRPGRTARVVGFTGVPRRRLRGWEGFVLQILLSAVIAIGFGELARATGGVIIPSP
jgi:hypothetical protein